MAAIISADSRDDDVSVLNATAESPRRDYSRNVSPISQSRQGRRAAMGNRSKSAGSDRRDAMHKGYKAPGFHWPKKTNTFIYVR